MTIRAMRTVALLSSQRFLTTSCTVHLNLLDEDEVTHGIRPMCLQGYVPLFFIGPWIFSTSHGHLMHDVGMRPYVTMYK